LLVNWGVGFAEHPNIKDQTINLGLTHERNVDVLLRRLANSNDIGPLRLLTSLVEPVKEYRRGEQRPSTMLSPLNGLVDAARPDSERARQFSKMVDEFLGDAPRFQLHLTDLRLALRDWHDANPALTALMDRSPALQEAKPLAIDLGHLGDTGLEAVSFISSKEMPPPEWVQTKLAVLTDAAKPKGAVELVVVSSVRKLVTAASELPQLKTMSALEWKNLVNTKASEPRK
jgi:hexosaminidase